MIAQSPNHWFVDCVLELLASDAAITAGSSESTISHPVTSARRSRTSPTGTVTMGRLQAMASFTTLGDPSCFGCNEQDISSIQSRLAHAQGDTLETMIPIRRSSSLIFNCSDNRFSKWVAFNRISSDARRITPQAYPATSQVRSACSSLATRAGRGRDQCRREQHDNYDAIDSGSCDPPPE